MSNLLNIIKNSNYSFSLFNKLLVDKLEQRIAIKDDKPYVICVIRNKEILLKPEEIVRQLYAIKLLEEYGYPQTIYQFKITLRDIKPPIWRRIQVPSEYTFWDLHVAIQDAMGWWDYHLHDFAFRKDRFDQGIHIGIPDPEEDTWRKIIPGWKTKITDYFKKEGAKTDYWYDFGDDWHHDVVLEKILPRDPEQRYPICISGKRACPHEDTGGVPGYYELIEAMADKNHERREELLEWLDGEPYEPEAFDVKDVEFTDPKPRLKALLEHMPF